MRGKCYIDIGTIILCTKAIVMINVRLTKARPNKSSVYFAKFLLLWFEQATAA